jgi:hypothetical protein
VSHCNNFWVLSTPNPWLFFVGNFERFFERMPSFYTRRILRKIANLLRGSLIGSTAPIPNPVCTVVYSHEIILRKKQKFKMLLDARTQNTA